MKRLLAYLMCCWLFLQCVGQDREPRAFTGDWRVFFKQEATLRNPNYGKLWEGLKKSKVPDEGKALQLAMSVVSDRNARSSWQVTALFRLGRDDKQLGSKGDFAWEVRVSDIDEVIALVWIGASTGTPRVLYPQ